MDDSRQARELDVPRHDGNAAVAPVLFARYSERLARLAETHLSQKLKGRVDGEDVAQSVFRTFFRRSARGEFQIDNSTDLWRLLAHITIRKVRRTARFHTAESRDVQREEPTHDGVGHEPDPAVAAELIDQIDRLLAGLPELYCQLTHLRLCGWSASEIADHVGVSRRTVYRALVLLQERLARQSEAPPQELSSES